MFRSEFYERNVSDMGEHPSVKGVSVISCSCDCYTTWNDRVTPEMAEFGERDAFINVDVDVLGDFL